MRKFLIKIIFVSLLSAVALTATADAYNNVSLPIHRKADSGLRAERKQTVASASKRGEQSSADNIPEIIASCIYSDAWSQSQAGLYTVPTADVHERRLLIKDVHATYGGVGIGDYYYEVYAEEFFGNVTGIYLNSYDLNAGKRLSSSQVPMGCASIGMALDPLTKAIYGIFYDDDWRYLRLGEIDLAEGTVTEIAPISGNWAAFSIGKDGTFYGIRKIMKGGGDDVVVAGSQLCTIDRNTAAVTVVGETGYAPYYSSGACIDLKSGRMFWTVSPADNTGMLCEVDLSSGAAALIHQFDDNAEYTGLYIPVDAIADDAPAAVEDIYAYFYGTALSGYVEVKVPERTYGGAELSTPLTLHILENGVEKESKSVSPGQEVSVKVTVSAPGRYVFAAYVSNSVGDGPISQYESIYVGADTPVSTTATLVYADGNMNLTWLPVKTSVNGEYFNPRNVSYTVTRYPDNVVVAEDIKVTSFSEPIAVPENLTIYYYYVVAKADGVPSTPARSNDVILGSLVPPFNADFDDSSIEYWTVIDANDDNNTWQPREGAMAAEYSSAIGKDDWLVTPPLHLKAGSAYTLSFDIWAGMSSHPENLEVMLGLAPTVEALNTPLIPSVNVSDTSDSKMYLQKTIMVDADGIYYIGFHALSAANKHTLYLDNVEVSAPKSENAPGAATDVVVTPAADGSNSAEISFCVPNLNLAGAPLESLSRIDLARDDKIIDTYSSPTPGMPLSYVDTYAPYGKVTYTITAYNDYGAGIETSIDTFIGFSRPAHVQNLLLQRTSVPGELSVSWTPVSHDVNGLALSNVNYTIYIIDGDKQHAIASNLTDTSYTWQAVPQDEQDFVQVAVSASDSNGNVSDITVSQIVAAGTPYDGMRESFRNGSIGDYIWSVSASGNAEWNLYTDASGIQAADGDNGFVALSARYAGETGMLTSGLISLSEIDDPTLSFYVYSFGAEDLNEVTVGIKDAETNAIADTFTYIVAETGEKGWNRIVLPLSHFADKTIQLMLGVKIKSFRTALLDNIVVGPQLENDLTVTAFSAPAYVSAGQEFQVSVAITNHGMAMAHNYTVDLYQDGVMTQSKRGVTLQSGRSAVMNFSCFMSPFIEQGVDYHVVINYGNDENEADNLSDTVTVLPIQSTLPAPGNLTGDPLDNKVNLNWLVPDISAYEAEQGESLDVIGYEIYRDGLKIGESVECSFSDFNVVADAQYRYVVFANYREGLSASSNEIVVSSHVAVSTVDADSVAVCTVPGAIKVINAAGVQLTVANASGAIIYIGEGCDETELRVAPGIYIVNAGARTRKVIVP